MSGGGMDNACAGIHGHVVGEHHGGGSIEERMRCDKPYQFRATKRFNGGELGCMEKPHSGFQERLRHEIKGAFRSDLGGDYNVLGIGMYGEREVSGDRPWGCRPYQDVGWVFRLVGEHAIWVFTNGKAHVDAMRNVWFVLHLGIGESGFADGAPQHRLKPTIDIPLFNKFTKHLHQLGLEFSLHGEIGVLPISADAEAFKLFPLDFNPVLGIFTAGASEGEAVGFWAFAAGGFGLFTKASRHSVFDG